ncbi:MAG TPA: Fic family protein [Candidatus Saccharimonadales bacterium]|nr:Fic family protein [Candidatus Saccharimonadales bacterium]
MRQNEIVLSILTGNTSLAKLNNLPPFREITDRTLQRDLSALVKDRVLTRHGEGRSVTYDVAPEGRLGIACPESLLEKILGDDKRDAVGYDFARLELLSSNSLFSKAENDDLQSYHHTFHSKLKSAPIDIVRRERERITIELSWKSSQFEGNTYTLLETESLLKEGIAARGRSDFETTMVLNHKKALDFSAHHTDLFAGSITPRTIIDLHKILIGDLDIGFGLRQHQVAITGTAYQPLDNAFQIKEELTKFCKVVNHKQSIFEKALLAFCYVSYLQPFNDGNKRTGRILANAILYAHDTFPLSLRAIDVNTYKLAMLAFYEFGIVGNAKQAFIEQAKFATENYAI